jgi:hypothetical protein
MLAYVPHPVSSEDPAEDDDGMATFRKLYRYPSMETAPDGPFTYEAYDLDEDPDEHANWTNDESRRADRDMLESELEALIA